MSDTTPSTAHLPLRVGVFDSYRKADRVVRRLLDAGFTKDHITVVCPHCEPEEFEGVSTSEPAGAHTPAAAVGGGAIGAVLGGLVALAGTAAATGGLALFAVGPLVLGAGGGAVAGGLVGAMMTRGVEKEVANFYDQALRKGQVLVAVEEEGPDAAGRLALAEEIFANAGTDPMPLREG
jgi:hypothetical protein